MVGSPTSVNIRSHLVPEGTIFNQSVTANTDILATPLNIVDTSPVKMTAVGTFTVEICFDVAGFFNVMIDDGTDTVSGRIRSSTALNAGEIFIFTKMLPEGYNMNFQFSNDANLNWMITTIHGGIY
jgi:hypothetical protein